MLNMSSFNCQPVRATDKDLAVSNAVVRDKLVACNLTARTARISEVNAGTVAAEQLLIAREDGVAGNVTLQLDADVGSAVPDAMGVVTVTGTGGNRTTGSGTTFTVEDLRSPTQYLVGATDAEYTDIQSAINAAGAGPAVILVRPGTYAGFTISNPGVTVKALGQGASGLSGATTISTPITVTAGALEGLDCAGGITATGGFFFSVAAASVSVTGGSATFLNVIIFGPISVTGGGAMFMSYSVQFGGTITCTSSVGVAGGAFNSIYSRLGGIVQTGDNPLAGNSVDLTDCVVTAGITSGTGASDNQRLVCRNCIINGAVTQNGISAISAPNAVCTLFNCGLSVGSGNNITNTSGSMQVYGSLMVNSTTTTTDRAVLNNDTNASVSMVLLNNSYLFTGATNPTHVVENNNPTAAAVWVGGNQAVALSGPIMAVTGTAPSGSVTTF